MQGNPDGLLLDAIEDKAKRPREEAVAEMKRADAVIANTETEPPI